MKENNLSMHFSLVIFREKLTNFRRQMSHSLRFFQYRVSGKNGTL